MVQGCTAAFGTLALFLGAAVTYTYVANPSQADERAIGELVKRRTQQRRLAGKGVNFLTKSLGDKFGWIKDEVASRSLDEDEGPECEKTHFASGDPNEATAAEWFKLKEDNKLYPCLNDIEHFEVVLNAMYYLTVATDAPSTVDLGGTLGTLSYDSKATDHTFVYQKADEDWVVIKHPQASGEPTADLFPRDGGFACEERCGVVQIPNEDAVCVGEEFKEEDCKVRVKALIDSDFLAKFEEHQEDGEKPPYCQLAATLAGVDGEDELVGYLDGLNDAQCKAAHCGDEAESKLDYNVIYVCTFKGNKGLTFCVFLAALLFYFVLMGVVADGYLVPALVQIGRGLNMSDALLGATLLALGGAANDFMTGFVSALGDAQAAQSETIDSDSGSSDEAVRLWLGSVFGTGFFVNTLVAAMVMVFAPPEGIPVKSAVFTRDVSFRIIAVSLMLVFGVLGYVNVMMAIIMVLFYIVYVGITLHESRQSGGAQAGLTNARDTQISGSSRSSRMSVSGGIGGRASVLSASAMMGVDGATSHCKNTRDEQHGESPGDRVKRHMGWEEDGGFMDKMNFVLALPVRPFFIFTMATTDWDPLVNIVMPMTMCIFIPYGNPFGNLYEGFTFGANKAFMGVVVFWLIGAACTVMVKAASASAPGRYISPMSFYWATFLTSLLWVGILANEVVGAMQTLGVIMGMRPMAMGITMLAWGNCVDNVFATIGLAKAGEFAVAITGIYAAPMFNVLFGNGSILVMLTLMKGGSTPFLMSTCPKILLSCLLVILFCTLLFAKMNGWRVNKLLGAILAISYPVILVIGFLVEGSPEPTPAD